MPYIAVDKTLLEVVATYPYKPVLSDSNLLVVEVKTFGNIVVRRYDQIQGEPDPETGIREITWTWISGTKVTQVDLAREIARQANQKARITSAVNTVISSVNGKLVTALTTTDVRNILAVLMVKEDWVDSAGKVAIPTEPLSN